MLKTSTGNCWTSLLFFPTIFLLQQSSELQLKLCRLISKHLLQIHQRLDCLLLLSLSLNRWSTSWIDCEINAKNIKLRTLVLDYFIEEDLIAEEQLSDTSNNEVEIKRLELEHRATGKGP